MSVIFPLAYFPPITFFKSITTSDAIYIECQENYVKQSVRNRCSILGANGRLELSIPIEKYANNTCIKDIKIDHRQNWSKQHWKSIISSYNTSPFFMYYDYQIEPIISSKTNYLFDFNLQIMEKLFSLLKLNISLQHTDVYHKFYSKEFIDLRSLKKNEVSYESSAIYPQVFDQKFGFTPNLSILDLLFNVGPSWQNYL